MFLRLLAIGVAAAAWLVPVPAPWVERFYSRGLFARLQPAVTGVSNRIPFSLFDVLLVGAAGLLVVATLRAVARASRSRKFSQIARFGVAVAALAALAYLVFLGMWGLNYRREPLTDRLGSTSAPADAAAVLRLGRLTVERLNETHDRAHGEGFPEWDELRPALESSYRAVQQRLAPGGVTARPGVPKWTILSYFFDRAGVSGMTDPFFLEVLVDRDLPPFERPFVLAHEWAHLAGYADEAEANFVGWVTCVNGGAPAAYSGWLYLYSEALGALPASDRVALVRALGPGPRADLSAVAERARRIQPALRSVSRQVYDRYLKANRVRAGIASYDRALLLVLRTRFVDGWMPVVKESQ
jgi:hypothetical protein